MQQLAKEPDLQQTLVQQLQASQNANQTTGKTNQPAPTAEQLADMQTQKQLNALQQSGLIIVQGTDYVIEVSLEQGKFIINGKPYDPSMMKF